MNGDIMDTLTLLEKLTSAVAVSGAEDNICNTLCDILKSYGDVYVDDLNNVYCTFGEGYHFLLDAHLDEIGLIVKSISDDGFIKVDKCGGIDNRMLLASEVSVWGDKEYRGVISTLPPHLQKSGDEKNSPDLNDISIDIGMTKVQALEHISLGDRVTFKRNFTKLLGNQISASVLDDRAGVASLILAIEELKKLNVKITLQFSSQEEVGTRGAKVGPYDKNIDEAIVVDVSFGYTPMCKKSDCGEIGKGPMIGISPILDNKISKSLVSTAKKFDIPYQIEVMGDGHTGTNADVISISQSGVKTALISIPEKYMHSPIEIVDVSDIENVSKLIVAYISERNNELNA
jgi:endoglucanase